MTDDSDNKRGRPREYGKDDVLAALRDLDDGSGIRTGEVADKVGCSTRTALRRLRALEDDGLVESTAVTERMKLWSVVEE
jgi:predicted ArsR family transcriptional regulator